MILKILNIITKLEVLAGIHRNFSKVKSKIYKYFIVLHSTLLLVFLVVYCLLQQYILRQIANEKRFIELWIICLTVQCLEASTFLIFGIIYSGHFQKLIMDMNNLINNYKESTPRSHLVFKTFLGFQIIVFLISLTAHTACIPWTSTELTYMAIYLTCFWYLSLYLHCLHSFISSTIYILISDILHSMVLKVKRLGVTCSNISYNSEKSTKQYLKININYIYVEYQNVICCCSTISKCLGIQVIIYRFKYI